MSVYLKQFSTHSEYEAYIASEGKVLPNVSICDDTKDVHYNPLECEETSEYEIVGTPSYPSTIDGDVVSFGITVNYKKTDTNKKCQKTVTEGTDTITVECGQNPSTSASRTVSGTVDYHGNEIEYSVTQNKFEAKVVAKFNVTSTSSPTKITNNTSYFSEIEIDDSKQPRVTTGYTFDTVGEHTVKYTLKDATSIGSNAFNGCTSLTSIVIPNSVTSIGSETFQYCSGLTSVTIPDSVTSIGENAFRECSSLTNIDIPNSVISIGNRAFQDCSGLTSIDIPSGVTSIGNYTFYGCRSLTSVTIPDSVTSIGGAALQSCSSLTSIVIPSGVTSIGSSSFRGCTSLTSIVSNATTAPTINNYTFQDIKKGGTLTVPIGSSGYDVWMGKGDYYLGKYGWTKVEQ